MIDGYYIIDCDFIDLASDETQPAPGLRDKIEIGMSTKKPLILFNCLYNGEYLSPVHVKATASGTDILLTNATLLLTVSNVDTVVVTSTGGSVDPTELNKKADKVVGATTGDLAALDASGNLTDSGVKASDFATASALSGKADTVSGATAGDLAALDSSGNLTDSGVKALDFAEKTDITSILATGATNTTGATITKGTYFYLDGTLCRAKADIATNASFTLNTNYEVVTVGGELTDVFSNASIHTVSGAFNSSHIASLSVPYNAYIVSIYIDDGSTKQFPADTGYVHYSNDIMNITSPSTPEGNTAYVCYMIQ